MTEIADEFRRSILRKEFYMDVLNCDPMSFDKKCELTIWWLHPQAPVESITPVLDIKNPAPALFIKIFCFLIFNTLY